MTQDELAAILFVSRPAISKWEQDKGYPSIESLKQLTKTFNVSMDELLSDKELENIERNSNSKEEISMNNEKELKNKSPKKSWLTYVGMSLTFVVVLAINIVAGLYSEWLTDFFGGRGTTEITQETLENADAMVQELEKEGIVLLKNENHALPLTKPNVNVFGWSSTDAGFKTCGSGSGDSATHSAGSVKPIKFLEALKKAGFKTNDILTQVYERYKSKDDRGGSLGTPSDTFFKFYEPDVSVYSETVLNQAKNFSDTAIVVISRSGGEGQDLPRYQTFDTGTTRADGNIGYDYDRTYLEISKREEDLINLVKNNFEKVVIVLNIMNAMELGFVDDDKIDACMFVGGPGQTGALSIAHVLQGRANPSGRLVDTYAYDVTTAASFENAADWGVNQYKGHTAREDKPNSSTPGSSYIDYAEGIYVGYKWYETADAEGFWDSDYAKTKWGIQNGYDDVVQYPFGYGLSYADFTWNVRRWIVDDKTISVDVEVKNSSTYYHSSQFKQYYAGKDVVELYFSPLNYKDGGIEKASVNLCAYIKTPIIAVGESTMVNLSFNIEDMKSYDCYDKNNNGHKGYELEAGKYEISLRTDSHTKKNCSNNTYVYTVDETIYYDEASTDGYKVENRFTGDNAYAGVSIDGSTTNENITYLTRSNFIDTFPKYEKDLNRTIREKHQLLRSLGLNWYEKVPASTMPVTGSKSTSYKLFENGEYNDELMCQLGSNYDDPIWEDLISQLTRSELEGLVGDAGFKTNALESIGKLKCIDVDGPSGLNANNIGGLETVGGIGSQTAYPIEVVIASTWNDLLVFSFGQMVGSEAAEANISGWYAPGANIHRNPFEGRNFEYYSEDAFLSGKICAYEVYGCLTKGLYSYIKHFAVNETEEQRSGLYTWLSEQALREIYLRPFEIAVKDGKANAFMTSFNMIGAIWAGGNKALLEDVVRGEWGFRGTMLTDWSSGGTYMNLDQGLACGSDAWLNGSHSSPGGHNDKNSNEGVRDMKRAAKNIVYTYCNTYYSAKHLGDNIVIKAPVYVFPVWTIFLGAIDFVGFGALGVWIFFHIKKLRTLNMAPKKEEEGDSNE